MKISPTNLLSQLLRSQARGLAHANTFARRAGRMVPVIALRTSAATLALFALFGFNPQTLAATYTKTATAGALNVAGSWSGGPPGGSDIGLFNNTITGTQSDTLGGSFAIGELQVTNPGGAITIAGDSSLYTLTLNGVTNASGVNVGIDMSTATQNLNYGGANDALAIGNAQSWYVATGETLTISGAVSGSGNITIGSGAAGAGGSVTLQTTADTYTGNYVVNNSTLTVNIGQASTAGFILNNGATLAGNQALASTNPVIVNSGASTISIQSSNTFTPLVYGNGNINWTEATVNSTNYGSVATSTFGNFGGTISWGTDGNELRIVSSTGSANSVNPFANFDLGSSTGNIGVRNGTTQVWLGGVQSTGASAGVGGAGSSGGHDVVYYVGSANLNQTFAGAFNNGGNAPTEVIKDGFGTLTLTGASLAADTTNYSAPATYTAAGGTLQLSFSARSSGILYAGGSADIANGGTLALLGATSGVSSQGVSGLVTSAGGGTLLINPNGGTSTTFNAGALSTPAAGATLDINENTGTATVTTPTPAAATGILGGGQILFTNASGVTKFAGGGGTANTSISNSGNFITLAGQTNGNQIVYTANQPTGLSLNTAYYVVGQSGNTFEVALTPGGTAISLTSNSTTGTVDTQGTIAAYTSASTYTTGVGSSTTNYTINDTDSVTSAAAFNTLQITNDTTAPTVTLGGNITDTTGSILFTGPNAETITGGSINSGAAVYIDAYSAGALTLSSPLLGASSLTVSGTGTVISSAGTGNTYTGVTNVNGGATLSIAANSDLGIATSAATLNLYGGTLQATSTFGLFNGSAGTNNRNVALGSGGGTIDVTNGNALTVAGVISDVTIGGTNISNSLNGALIKADSGTLVLSGAANTYGGATIINGGILSVSTLANGNSNSSIGSSPATANALVINGGTLQYGSSATGASTTNRAFTIGTAGGTLDASGPSGDTVTFSSTSPVWYTASGSRTLNLVGSNTGANVLDAAITDPSFVLSTYTGQTAVSKSGAGEWVLGGANSYGGGTTVSAGTLQLATGDTAALGSTSGALAVTGGTVDLNSNSITTGAFSGGGGGSVESTTGAATLSVVQGASTSNTFAGVLKNGGGTLGFATLTSGTTVLSGVNTYTGATTVGAGTAVVLASGGALGSTAVAVNGTLLANKGNGGIGGTVTLNSGSILSQEDGNTSPGSLTLGGLTINGSTALDYDIYGSTANSITVSGGALGGTGNGVINFANLGGTSPADYAEYTILTDSAGFGSDTFSLGTTSIMIGGQAYTLNLTNSTSTAEIVTLDFATLNYYWTGGTSSSWSALSNFATNNVGNVQQTTNLSNTSNVFLTADSASNFSQTLDGSYTVNSLTLTGTSVNSPTNSAEQNSVTLAPGSSPTNTLTITAGNTFTDADGVSYSGVGLEDQAGAAAATISANINLGNSQAWKIDSANGLLVSGTIGNGSSADALTKTGAGPLTLSAVNTYTGGTTVSAGTLALSSGGSIGTSGVLTVNGTGTFDLVGNNQTVGGLSDGGVSTGVITSSTGSAILTVNDNSTAAFSGTITDNNATNGSSLALVFAGSSTETLSGSNSFTGGTTVSSGAVVAANNYALGNSTSSTGGLLLNPSSGTATVDFTSATPSIASLASSGVGISAVVLGNSASGGSPTTLTVGGGGQTTTFGGVISDQPGANANAVGSLTIIGGSLTLGGADTYTGATTLSGGTLILGNTLALQDSTLSDNAGGGTLSFGTITSATLGGLTGNANIALANTTPAAVALSVGNDNASTSYTGNFSGSGSLTKVGAGALTLSGDETYAGSTTVNAGTLTFASGSALGSSGTPSGAITNSNSTLNINNTAIYASSLTTNDTGPAYTNITAGSSVNITGAISLNTNDGANQGILTLSGGTLTGASLSDGRDSLATTYNDTEVLAGVTGDGIYIDGGNLVLTNTSGTVLGLGTLNSDNSSASLRMDSGSVTVDGPTVVTTQDNDGRESLLDINGGTFTSNDTTGIGIQLGGDGVSNQGAGELLVRGTGVVNTPQITLGGTGQTAGTNQLVLIGGTTNIGSGGIVSHGAITPNIYFGSASVATAPTVASTLSWSSTLSATLTNDSAGASAIFAPGAGTNITLAGALGGTGGLTVNGAGTLTLTAGNFYTGITTLDAGTLNINGEYALGGAVYSGLTFNGGTLQYATGFSGNGTGDITQNSAATPVAKPVTVASGGATIDTNGNNVSYANTFGNSGTGNLSVIDSQGTGSLTLAGTANYSGSTTVSGGGTLIVTGGLTATTAVNVNAGGTLDLNANNAINNSAANLTLGGGTLSVLASTSQTLGSLTLGAGNSTLIMGDTASVLNLADSSGATWTGTLTIEDWVGGSAGGGPDEIFIGSSADLTTAQLNDITFVNSTADGVAFSSYPAIQLADGEIVASVPEPGTWASLLGGLGMLLVWQKNRRRRA